LRFATSIPLPLASRTGNSPSHLSRSFSIACFAATLRHREGHIVTNVTRRIVLSLILALVFVLTAAPLAGAQNLERLRLSEVVRSLFYAPQYVALELGFFRDEGFDIELSTAFGADKGAAALISGSVDIGFFGPEAAVYIYLQGARDYLVAFAQLTAMDGSFLMAREPTDNFQWTDLKGKV